MATSKVSPRGSSAAISLRRAIVHVALVAGFLAAIVSAVFLSRKYLGHSGTTNHAIIGVVVFGFVVIHLVQRRRTVAGILRRLARHGTQGAATLLRAESDMVLWLLMLNATVSGTVDYVKGETVMLPIPGPFEIRKWHEVSAIILLVYVVVHVIRRRRRFFKSRIQ